MKEQAYALSNNHDITLIACNVDYSHRISFFKSRKVQTDELQFREIYLNIGRSLPVYNQLNFFLTARYKIGKMIRDNGFDLIHAHVAYPAGVLAQMISSDIGIPYVITEHASPFESLFRTKLHKYFTLRALESANLVLTVSRSSAEAIGKYVQREVLLMPNLLADEKLRLPKERDDGLFRIGFLGGLNTNQKGLDYLLHAFACLKNRERVKLLIAGDGVLRQSFETMSHNLGLTSNIEFLGTIHPDAVQDFMSSLDLFVLPSRHETFGIVAVEAMACGLPVVASDCGGPREYMRESNGILIPVGDVKALAEAMDSVLTRKRTFEPSSIQASVIEQFGTSSFIRKIEAYYQSILKD